MNEERKCFVMVDLENQTYFDCELHYFIDFSLFMYI